MSLLRPLIIVIKDLDVVNKAIDYDFIKDLDNEFIKALYIVIKALIMS